MEYKNLSVTTESGFVCRFYEENDGTQKVVCSNGGAFFENILIKNSVGELKKGKKLKFRYYDGFSVESFESSTDIALVEEI